MLSRYGDVTGIDISDRVVTENRRVFPNIEFVSGDFLTIPSKRHSIDLVVASEIIEHIPHEKQEDFLRRVSEWLRPQAYLILTTPNRSTMERLHIRGNQLRENPLYPKELKDLLSRSGFETVKFFTTHFLNENRLIGRVFWFSPRTYRLIDYVLRSTDVGLYVVTLARKTYATCIGE